MLIVVDASAMIEVLLRTTKAVIVERHLREADGGLDAPHLIDVEIAQVLRRFVLRGDLSAERAGLALLAHEQFPLRRHPHTTLLPRLWRWRNNLSAYEAVYVALAEVLEAPLVTCDGHLDKAAGAGVDVVVV